MHNEHVVETLIAVLLAVVMVFVSARHADFLEDGMDEECIPPTNSLVLYSKTSGRATRWMNEHADYLLAHGYNSQVNRGCLANPGVHYLALYGEGGKLIRSYTGVDDLFDDELFHLVTCDLPRVIMAIDFTGRQLHGFDYYFRTAPKIFVAVFQAKTYKEDVQRYHNWVSGLPGPTDWLFTYTVDDRGTSHLANFLRSLGHTAPRDEVLTGAYYAVSRENQDISVAKLRLTEAGWEQVFS